MKHLQTILAFLMLSLIFACDPKDNVTGTDGNNTIGGETKLPYTKVETTYSTQFFIDGVEAEIISKNCEITKNDNGNIEMNTKFVFNESQYTKIKNDLGLANVPAVIEQQIAEKLSKEYNLIIDTADKNNMALEFNMLGKITSEGVQDYIISKGDKSKPFTVIKYDAKLRDKYVFTDDNGLTRTRTVVFIDNLPTYEIEGKKVKIYMTEEIIVSETLKPYIKKATAYTCKEYGLVQMDFELVSGKVITIKITPEGIEIENPNDDEDVYLSKILLTTDKEIGETINLELNSNIYSDSIEPVWIDIDNDGVRDEGEMVDYNASPKITLKSKTLAIYGYVRTFNCRDNKISELDLTKSKYINSLHCDINNIKNLNLSKNLHLYNISCSGNQIEILDVTMLKKLEMLFCGFNKLHTIKLNNPNLTYLECPINDLSKLDVSKCPKLENFGVTEIN